MLCVPNYLVAQSTSKVGDEVIAHYTCLGDNEKLKAAKFLVENMKYHSFKDSPGFTECFNGIERINAQYKYPDCIEQYNSLFKGLSNPYSNIKNIPDKDVMDVKSLIDNIDRAFDDWRNGLWARHLKFDCTYSALWVVNKYGWATWAESSGAICRVPGSGGAENENKMKDEGMGPSSENWSPRGGGSIAFDGDLSYYVVVGENRIDLNISYTGICSVVEDTIKGNYTTGSIDWYEKVY